MDELQQQMQEYFLQYASYVILDRAIPHVIDGLKPVQRRILHTLFKMDDGKLHKVANVAGQTMAYHPHGDAPITEALVNLANKGLLLDKQGNFGNLYTGDPAAAARYIETRLSILAKETLFNEELTEMIPSYDARNQEPIVLPAKIPILLAQGAEGIAVGMATKILPHNFQELLQAQIAYLEERPFTLLPDFPTGGIMDASDYRAGLGKVRLRAKLSSVDDKTILIHEICFGTTTESLIQSIDEAAKKGKIKIDSISDFTSDKVEIEIKLPRGQHADQIMDALYGFTECEVQLTSQVIVIKDNLPWQTNVDEILKYNTDKLVGFLRQELELAREKLLEKIFLRTLERIFIAERLYKQIEEVASYPKIHETIAQSLVAFHKELLRIPTEEDREKLLSIPIRRITRFDINKNQEEILAAKTSLEQIEKDLKQLKRYTIKYLKELHRTFASPRKTEIQKIETVDMKAISTKKIKLCIDTNNCFLGTKVPCALSFECTNFDKILLLLGDGSYFVTNIEEKKYIGPAPLIFAGVADKVTIFTALYRLDKQLYIKRFVIDKFILEKKYRFLPEGAELEFVTIAQEAKIDVHFKPQPKQKVRTASVKIKDFLVKGVATKGVRLSEKPIKSVKTNVTINLACINTAMIHS